MACIKKRRGKWVVDWRSADGRRHWETSDDKEKAKSRLSEILGKNKDEDTETRTFAEYGDWWLENVAKAAVKESTYAEYQYALKKHVYSVIGAKRFAKVNRPMIRELIAAKKKEGLSQSTIRNIMAPVRGMYNQAIDDEKIGKNPAARIGKMNKRAKDAPGKKINPLTREEVQGMLQIAAEKYSEYYPVFLCAPRTGIRLGELMSLKGIDVDFNSRFIHVQRNLSRGKISATKNGKDRKVDMSAKLAETLSDMLSKRRADALREEFQKPAEARRDRDEIINEVMEGWLFQTPVRKNKDGKKFSGGTRLDPRNLRKLFHRLLIDAKLRRVRFHDLRHTFASLLLQNGESPVYVKEQCGHSSIQVTVDIYGHLVPGGNRAAVDKLDLEVPEKTETEPEAVSS